MVWFGYVSNHRRIVDRGYCKVAGSEANSRPGSVALNVIVSEPFQSASGIVIVATLVGLILTCQRRVAGVGPGHLGIGVVDISDIVVKIDSRESRTFSYGLIRDVSDHRSIVNRSNRKGSGV